MLQCVLALFLCFSSNEFLFSEIEENSKRYDIVYSEMSYFLDSKIFIIHDSKSNKDNIYLLDPYFQNEDIYQIVLKFSPLSLEFAQKLYPELQYNEENYGFILL